ncbi:MAG TPA: OmpA family protein, partial [Spirochaetota bacterium]|nr:OmpA family protein [Spirochaetota bacterium]
NYMYKYFLLFLLLLNISTIFCIEIRYKYPKDSILYIENISNFNQFVNGEFILQSRIKEISYIEHKSANKNLSNFSKTSYILEERKSVTGSVYAVKENYKYDYSKDTQGKTFGLEGRLGLHNFLIFPKKDLKIGESWLNEVFYNVNLFGNNVPFMQINFDIVFRLLNTEDVSGDKICYISGNTLFTKDKNRDIFIKYNIVKYLGYSSYLIKFNISQGRILSIEELFDYSYLLEDGTLIENSGTANFTYELPPPPRKDEIERMKEIKRKKVNIKDVNINENADNTVTISVEKIQFKPDSAILTDEELKRIDEIANLLLNYKSNNIVIVGHTANVGNKNIQKRLSEERAKVVVEYLIKNHGFSNSHLSYLGKGGEEPISDNSTEEGKAKNRRVEIIILRK